MSERIPKDWLNIKLGESLVQLPKSKLPSGIAEEAGYYNFYVCSQNILKSFHYEMSSPSLLFSTGGEAAVHYATGKYSYSTDVWATDFKGQMCNEYVYHLLQANLEKINYMGFQGSGIKHLDKDFIKDLKFFTPPLPEQKKIASILASVGGVIEKTQSQIDKLQDLKKGTMNELLTKGIGHTDFKDSELGRIPKNWEIVKLGDVTQIFFSNVDKKSDPSEIPIVLCNYMDVYENQYIKQGINFMEATAKQREIDKFSLKLDDVIITKDSETPQDIAVATYVAEELEGVLCGYHLALIRSDKNKLHGSYLAHIFAMDTTKKYFYRLANGSTRYGLTTDSIINAEMLLPSLSEQKKIAANLNCFDEIIEKKQEKLQKFQSLKKSLMQDLLTGKVRVPVN